MKTYKKVLIVLIVFIIIVVLGYILIDFLSKIGHFTGVITSFSDDNIYFDINVPSGYVCSKDFAIIYDKNGNLIDVSTIKINDEISIYNDSSNKVEHGIVSKLDDEQITLDTFLTLHYFCFTEGAKIKDSKGNKINVSDLHIGDKIRVTNICNYWVYDNSIKNVKLIEVLDEE